MNKTFFTIALLFITLASYSLDSIFKYKRMVYQSIASIDNKESKVIMKLQIVDENMIEFEIEIFKPEGIDGISTDLKYKGIDTNYNVTFKDNQIPAPVILLSNYDGFKVWISTDEFNKAKIFVPNQAENSLLLGQLIFEKAFPEEWE